MLITVFSAPLAGTTEAEAGADETDRALLETALFLLLADEVGALDELAAEDDAALDVEATAAPPTVLGS